VWKYPEEKALKHNAGMPNPGAANIALELKDAQLKIKVPWGLNIAVSPGLVGTPTAVEDIVATATLALGGGLRPDWLTLNVSSPDTDDKIAMLMDPQRVWALCKALKGELAKFSNIPLWLKIAPAQERAQYAAIAKVILEVGVETVVATNTMADGPEEIGGWCGEPLRAQSSALVWEMNQLLGGKVPIVAVGGVYEGKHVQDKLAVGASAVQVVSALLFRGREAARTIRREYEILVAEEKERELGRSSS
jgi:dihydroorotate dehydrogenase